MRVSADKGLSRGSGVDNEGELIWKRRVSALCGGGGGLEIQWIELVRERGSTVGGMSMSQWRGVYDTKQDTGESVSEADLGGPGREADKGMTGLRGE